MKAVLLGLAVGLGWCGLAQAVDQELLQRYQARQQVHQSEYLSQARQAALRGDFAEAERQLATARNLAPNPSEVAAVETLIRDGKARVEQERLARLEQERLARESAERERREQEARLAAERSRQEAARQAQATASSASSSAGGGAGRLESSLDFNYDYSKVYTPPVYESRLKERGIIFKEYVWETQERMPGYTSSTLERVYFSVRLKNGTGSPMEVSYRIKARERFSVGRTASNATKAGFWAVAGYVVAAGAGVDPEAGAALGAAGAVAHQAGSNQWFDKTKDFTVTLAPGEERYETGSFPVNKTLSENPSIEILRVR